MLGNRWFSSPLMPVCLILFSVEKIQAFVSYRSPFPTWIRDADITTQQPWRILKSSAQQQDGKAKKQHYVDNLKHKTTWIGPHIVGNLNEVDVLYETTTQLIYDPVEDRYRKRTNLDRHMDDSPSEHSSPRPSLKNFYKRVIAPRLSVAFLPAGVTSNYYSFMRWRFLQRFVNANLHVFGTQSLLMGLGIKSSASQLGALSAALKWVLKDALGKIVRMAWASWMGRRFDSDAKRWRFRSAFVYAMGNALEITTYIIPSMFLLWATLANCCKQVSMLTSSSTRTGIYNSFRDGTRENISDITAKGEAQIAVVDLLGIASGVMLSRAVGTQVRSVLAVYASLQALEIMFMYRQLRAVVYRVLNFERMAGAVNDFLDTQIGASCLPAYNGAVVDTANGENLAYTKENEAKSNRENVVNGIKTPLEMAQSERIFLPPKHLSRRATAFGSLGRTKLSPAELQRLLEIFAKERFLLVVGANLKNPTSRRRRRALRKEELLKESCHIVLHKDATKADIVKSTLALMLLRRKLAESSEVLNPHTVRSLDCFKLIQQSLEQADELFGLFRKQLGQRGWESPARAMFGRVQMRAEWPLAK